MPLPPPFRARLVASRTLTPAVRELRFERADGAPMEFEAGQWVQAALPLGDPPLRRSYSIASGPDGSPRFDLAVTHVEGGPGSTYLHGLEPGAELDFIGPQGFFTRPLDTAPPSLFVATGTGVTPFRSMLHAAARASQATPTWLLLGVRREEDILYRDEFEALAHRPHVRFFVTLSRGGEAWSGRRAYVQSHVRALYGDLAAIAGRPHVYVCGLERMIKEVRDLVRKDMGLPRQEVHSERYD
jgi:ferredoxin-NADP reductase